MRLELPGPLEAPGGPWSSGLSVTWLVILVSAPCSNNNWIILHLLSRTASWRGVSPSWNTTQNKINRIPVSLIGWGEVWHGSGSWCLNSLTLMYWLLFLWIINETPSWVKWKRRIWVQYLIWPQGVTVGLNITTCCFCIFFAWSHIRLYVSVLCQWMSSQI